MNIPPKYEDLVLKVAELERREAALLESLTDKREEYNKLGDRYDALQQRLTVAEKLAGELEAAAQEMLRVAGIANQGSRAYTRAIINLNAALKPVSEVKS